ncbi:MAG TPA: permease-like cell division protein FtsX [Chitinophagales bacterium]|jgi:cell division transport system permease protein|nr:permease-like cell division protein FtsX [Chitinophagales bacterium]HQW78415.1 permease-like cell division protein FtsX [Chitinophagales bacterium]HRB18813.1 permease-like cell division protein FtsX [Chitinophagales bacterium]HRB68097.1 permease-like cell division protein FtsX [Chitinophagales bacterium]
MSDELEQKAPVKRKPNFGFAIISIAMILFIIGLFSFGVFTIQKQIKEIKESVQIDLNLKADVTDAQKESLTKYLKKQKFISKISYKSKEVAAQQFEKELGQNFTEILGSNPLYDAYIISLKSDYTNPEFIQEVKSDFLAQSGVQEVQYSELAINSTSTTLKPITIGIVVLSIIMLIVAFLIIDNTIRLMMYSQRFLIRSMQLIGANEWFIIKPYLLKSIITGIISAAIAILCLIIIIYLTINKFGLQFVTQDFVILSFIALGLIIFGIIISITSTYFSVNKYLKVKLDELY